ncbi:DUF4192 domain-containing protein [Gordonia rhizosphera]|uniref:DUF4192 domain-containing protein n=1 Tax=Gordonia rhizosphera NBRC 16068 TaxID=1108045 RepID=K6W2H9_9ACTN|nr:DUF4192 domain-containing protein [Gordonia rhizosphera]GAB93355.1 hypothetical protein GORHZ_214_00130 [Gordonia rhizosphera NBRC 16068]
MPPNRCRPLAPSALLTAIPGLLGFIPDRSLVFVAFGEHPQVVRTTIRHDLVLDDDGTLVPGLIEVLADLGEICIRNDVRAVVAVIADDRYPPGDRRYREVCVEADKHFAGVGGVSVGFVVPAFADGAAWRMVWESRVRPVDAAASTRTVPVARTAPIRGRLADPHSSPTAIHHAVKTGRRVLEKRSDMEEMLTPLPHCAGPHREPADDTAVYDDAGLLRALLDQVIAIGDPGRHTPSDLRLDCATTGMLAYAVTRLPVRDAALSLAVTAFRHQAETLWRELARRLTGSARASAATMLAHLHYIGGEGGYAGVALDCALSADPDWSLAVLLDRALSGGLPPRMLWEMLDDSYDTAKRLGVPIPQPISELEVS